MKKGIPKEVIDEIDISKKEKKKEFIIKGIIEHHQSRLTIPKKIVLEAGLEKDNLFEVRYDKEKREIIYKLK